MNMYGSECLMSVDECIAFICKAQIDVNNNNS